MEKRQIDITITSWKQDYVNGKQKVFYEIAINLAGNKWELRRRYNEFSELQKALKFHFSNLPSLPGKTLFGLKKPADIEKRKTKLETYLRALVAREEFYANEDFIKFFEVRFFFFMKDFLFFIGGNFIGLLLWGGGVFFFKRSFFDFFLVGGKSTGFDFESDEFGREIRS